MADQQGSHHSIGYRGMDVATLEHEYNARATVPSLDDERALDVQESQRVQDVWPNFETWVYDKPSGQKIDVYGVQPGRPLFLWIHGGYWRGGSRQDNAFAAGGLLARGVSVAVFDYSLAPAVGMGEIVRQVQAAVAWLIRLGRERGLR